MLNGTVNTLSIEVEKCNMDLTCKKIYIYCHVKNLKDSYHKPYILKIPNMTTYFHKYKRLISPVHFKQLLLIIH